MTKSHDSSTAELSGASGDPPGAAARQAGQRIREETVQAAGQVQRQARAFLAEQKDVAADHIENLSQVLHQTVDQLREKSPGAVSDYAARAVGGLDSVAAALRKQDVRSLVGTAESFARRQPALFIAGSVAMGFALARFLKSSADTEEQGQHGGARGSASRFRSEESRAPRGADYRKHFDTERHRSGTGGTQTQESGVAIGKESE